MKNKNYFKIFIYSIIEFFRALRNYIECVKYPVRYQCGYRPWYALREMLVRFTTALLKNCIIADARDTRSIWNYFYDIVAGMFSAATENLWS